jgi:Zeta toxin
MIWNLERNRLQGRVVARLAEPDGRVPCQRLAVIAGGLPGADKPAVLAAAGVDRDRFLTVSVGAVLEEMAAAGLIPVVAGLSPMEAADLAHTEAQHVAKRVAMRSLADGRNVIFDVSMASSLSVTSWLAALRSAGYAATGVFAELSINESVRRADVARRRGEEEYRRGRGHGGRYIPAEAIRALTATVGRPDDWIEAARGDRDVWFLGGLVTAMIDAWRAGQVTLAELVRQFSARTWPAVPSVCPPGLADARAAIDDLEPYVPGSFDDVVAAYDLGQLSDTEYGPLAVAAARARARARSTPYGLRPTAAQPETS